MAHHPDVAAVFVDGIHWIELGDAPDLVSAHASLALDLGLSLTQSQTRSIRASRDALSRHLSSQSVLLVLNDVRAPAHLALSALLDASPNSRYLITTPEPLTSKLTSSSSLPTLAIFHVPLLSSTEARDLLALSSQTPEPALPLEADRLLEACASLPLAGSLVGNVVANKGTKSWAFALAHVARSHSKGFTPIHMATALSVRALHALRYRFFDLIAFPGQKKLYPFDPLVMLWSELPEPLEMFDVELICRELASRNLLRVDNLSQNPSSPLGWSMTAITADYLAFHQQRHPAEAVAAHRALLAAYGSVLTPPVSASSLGSARWRTGPIHSDAYFRHFAVSHLIQAGEVKCALDLVASYRWFLNVTRAERDADPWLRAGSDSLASYLDDMTRVMDALEADPGLYTAELSDLVLLRELLILSRSALVQFPSMTYFQFLSRLWPVPEPGTISRLVVSFIESALSLKSRPEMLAM